MPEESELKRVTQNVDRLLQGRLRDFRVASHEHGWVLHGVAPSFYVKQLAYHAVMKATTRTVVGNEIEVP